LLENILQINASLEHKKRAELWVPLFFF